MRSLPMTSRHMTTFHMTGQQKTCWKRSRRLHRHLFTMKLLVLLAFVAIGQSALLGTKKCTYGPSYWCSHIHHAKECHSMQHCMTTVWKNRHQASIGSTESCYDVIKILGDVRHSGAPDLREQMAKSCTQMPDEKHSMCKDLMMNDQNEVLLLLQSDLPSINVAAALGLCGEFSDTVPHPLVEDSVKQPHVEKDQVAPLSGDYCTDCLNFFGDLQEIFNNTVLKLSEQFKEKICSKLGPFEKFCNQTTDAYAELITDLGVQQLNPQDMCFLLQMCDSETPADVMKKVKSIIAKVPNSVDCDLCKKLIKDVQNVLREPTLQNDIINIVNNDLCPLLPGDLAAQCKSYVSQYGPLLFQVLIAELDPVMFCETLGFCNATETKHLTVVPLGEQMSSVHVLAPEHKEQAHFGPFCYICKEVMEKLEGMLDPNATKQEIDWALEEVCSLLPEKLKTECDDFVKAYGSLIEEALAEMAPALVCTALGLCEGNKPVNVEHHMPVKDDEKCLICETAVAYIKSLINNPDNVKTIEQLLSEVCGFLPSSYKLMCEEIVNVYTPDLIKLLNKYDDPQTVCSKLGLCDSTKTAINKSDQSAHPLLFQPRVVQQAPTSSQVLCSKGPKFFCATVETARPCKAVDFCVKYFNLKRDA